VEETIIETWKRVKNLEISLISATVVAYFAMYKIRMMDSQLSAHYPSYTDATTLFAGLKEFLSPKEYEWVSNHSAFKLLKIILEYYQDCSEELSDCYGRGERLIREKKIPEQLYHNEFNGRPLTDNQADIKAFLDYEIMVLFNALVDLKKETKGNYDNRFDRFNLNEKYPMSDYIDQFDWFFQLSFNIRTPLIFLTLCWIRSVQCLEDSDRLFLYKTVYLYRSFIRQRNTNFKIHLDRYDRIISFYGDSREDLFEEFRSHREYYDDPESCLNRQQLFSWNLYRHHPFLLGVYFLEEVFFDHDKCDGLLNDDFGFSLTFPLLYRSFKATGKMSETIPFLEDFLDFIQRSYRLRHSPIARPLPPFIDPSQKEVHFTILHLLNYSNDPKDRCGPGYLELIDESLCSLKWRPEEVSVVFGVLCESICIHLKVDAIFTEESYEEMIQITERELLNGGYLSVDLFKYFIAFRGFLTFLEKATVSKGKVVKPSPIKEWYDRDCPNQEQDFFTWVERRFFPFLAKVMKHKGHTSSKKDMPIVTFFIWALTTYFNGTMKDREVYGERTFTIPKDMNWQMIYEARFGQSFTIGFQSAWTSARTNCHNEHVIKTYMNFSLGCTENHNNSKLRPLEVTVQVQKIIRNNLTTLLSGELSRGFSFFGLVGSADNLCNEELFEFMFASYGSSSA
jgi:hypothetical protein